MRSGQTTQAEEILQNLIHDIRQPLGAIETWAYVLKQTLEGIPAGGQLRHVERQVQEAANLLDRACADLARLRAQRTAAASLAFTNSHTAGVT